ncbi:GIY-YIG nuclease family protein [Epilithonimonas hominis]|uniref:GIY-YIG nuclease family protein n=1 Tax=Epilithonimonas hominis TaxID=420404 RepID=A0A3N0XBV2_9FLAO|nr:GIY-YIG nuclease family protein [Epilithonimonas hominis]
MQKKVSTVFNEDVVVELKNIGFKGFISIEKIIENYNVLPKQKGVYILIHSAENPRFLAVGTGGYFKQREPNVDVEELKKNWVEDSSIIYIGKAGSDNGGATLQSRLKQYFNFGQGKAVGHWGGRYIWQLEEPYKTIVCWMETPDTDPRKLEAELIKQFVKKYGQRPFANLVG